MAENSIRTFKVGRLFGLLLNGKKVEDAQYYRINIYPEHATAIGKSGYFLFEIEKDAEGNPVAIIKKKIEDWQRKKDNYMLSAGGARHFMLSAFCMQKFKSKNVKNFLTIDKTSYYSLLKIYKNKL